jgi:hypothetical protein
VRGRMQKSECAAAFNAAIYISGHTAAASSDRADEDRHVLGGALMNEFSTVREEGG